MESTVTVVAKGTEPEFQVTYDNGKKACVKGLTVTGLDGGERENVWALRRSDKATCADRFAYGVAPPGYDVVVSAKPLSPQRNYEVSASGSGWSDTRPLMVR